MEKSVNKNIFRLANDSLTDEDILMMNPLKLAFVGDACYELLVRTWILDKKNNPGELHKIATKLVKGRSQAETIKKLDSVLTEKEKEIVKRGRNAKGHAAPKNTDIVEYRLSTGFEALFGYLFLTNQDERLGELFNKIISEA